MISCTPFCLTRLSSTADAKKLISRSILVWSIHELWGSGPDYASLHTSIREVAADLIPMYRKSSFKFLFDTYQGSRSAGFQRQAIESLSWLSFEGPISMKAAQETFTIFEEYHPSDVPPQHPHQPTSGTDREGTNECSPLPALRNSTVGVEPTSIYFGRLVGTGDRNAMNTYSLKKRQYLSTTSMDAELALIMANLTLARPGTLFYDPFVGTGSLTVACAHYGSFVWGSDIDGRSIRGKNGVGLSSNYAQYGLQGRDLSGFTGDLVNSPIRGWRGSGIGNIPTMNARGEWLDGIVCDPPYGVREGLRVLGARDGASKEIKYLADGTASHLQVFLPRTLSLFDS